MASVTAAVVPDNQEQGGMTCMYCAITNRSSPAQYEHLYIFSQMPCISLSRSLPQCIFVGSWSRRRLATHSPRVTIFTSSSS